MTKPAKPANIDATTITPELDTVKLTVLCNVIQRGALYGKKGEVITVPSHVAKELLDRKPAIVKKA